MTPRCDELKDIDGDRLEGLQKVVNITLGVILAAMIIGAATADAGETPFRILGYP